MNFFIDKNVHDDLKPREDLLPVLSAFTLSVLNPTKINLTYLIEVSISRMFFFFTLSAIFALLVVAFSPGLLGALFLFLGFISSILGFHYKEKTFTYLVLQYVRWALVKSLNSNNEIEIKPL